jgi:hypothetical protein
MMMQCLKYKGNELLKMYPTWTKSEAKELTRKVKGETQQNTTKHK